MLGRVNAYETKSFRLYVHHHQNIRVNNDGATFYGYKNKVPPFFVTEKRNTEAGEVIFKHGVPGSAAVGYEARRRAGDDRRGGERLLLLALPEAEPPPVPVAH